MGIREGAESSMKPLALPRGRKLSFSGRPLIMGILNLTNDSFFLKAGYPI